MTYQAWIDQQYPTAESARGHCAEATLAMRRAFPELTRVRGHYVCTFWGERAHWWLTAPDGRIVDPTVRQFPSATLDQTCVAASYIPWVEGALEPTGRCLECGADTFHGRSSCSDACAHALEAYYNHALRRR